MNTLTKTRLTKLRLKLIFGALILVSFVLGTKAHDQSVHDTVANVLKRMQRQLSSKDLIEMTPAGIHSFLTPEERQTLGRAHIHFNVNIPVTVTIVRDAGLGEEPYWLRERKFSPTGLKLTFSNREFDTWEKSFPAGEIGLGIHNLTGSGTHYLVLLRPQSPGETNELQVTNLYPAKLRTTQFAAGIQPFVDHPVILSNVPPALEGQLLVRTETESEEDARLVNLFSQTQFPAGDRADHVVLTWSDDPRTTQTIQWRTSTSTKRGVVRYFEKACASLTSTNSSQNGSPKTGVTRDALVKTQRSRSEKLVTPRLLNDPSIRRHTVTLKDLKPGTTYVYEVGDGSATGWTGPAEFTTAPEGVAPFSFIYMGDAQNGLDQWGKLLRNAYAARPDAAFYLMAGDLVNRGAERWDWDSFFENSKGVFDRRQLVPVIGNHECQEGAPALYLKQFSLPRNGPPNVPEERVYSFEYSNAKFIILDSNLDPQLQTEWLEKELANTTATWKFVSYHHPAYSSSGSRNNLTLRHTWTPIFDKYHVDLALQGHDHAYLRTWPMRGGERVATAKDGTVYIISVSGTKYYPQPQHGYTEVGFTRLSTYQVLDIQVSGNRLVYRAHNRDGQVPGARPGRQGP